MAKALSKRRPLAFSLVEFLLVIALIAILSGMFIYHGYFHQSRLLRKAVVYRVQQALFFTRRSAILLQDRVTYCGSADLQTCDGRWSQGQIVVTSHGKRLQVYAATPRRVSLHYLGNLGRSQGVVYTPQGFTQGQQGHFEICTQKTSDCEKLIVHYSGEVVAH